MDPDVGAIIDRLTEVAGVPPIQITRIYDRNGDLLYEISDHGRRTLVPLERIPESLIQATIATEDGNFYQNSGIDLSAIARAAWQNLRAGKIVSGGSTITQQLARLLVFDDDERYAQSLTRKVREAALALKLSRRYSKDEILEMYLNTLYYGNQAYGAAEAARAFFNKDVSELTLAESALLAGLPQAPIQLNPFVDREAAKKRQRVVLELMRREGYIDDAQMEAALAEDLKFESAEQRGTLRIPHFVDYVRALLLERYGPEGMRQGLQVYTSIDPRYQELAAQILRAQVEQIGERHHVSNGAVVIIHPPTGQILAMVGSLDYYNEDIAGQVNVAVRQRQAGSAVKPVLYAAAFDNGWSPASVIWDTPAQYPLGHGRWYAPRNVTGRFYGPLRLRGALANSLNVAAVKLLDEVGIPQMLETARKMGITSWRSTSADYGLSLAIGSYELTLLELTHAFATLANNGAYVPVAPVTEVRDAAGRVLFRAEPPDPPQYAIAPTAAYQVTSVLSDTRSRQPLFGRSSALDTSQPTAVKTGTTDGWRDSLTVGYTSYLAVGVWMGNSDGQPMDEAPGFEIAGPVWHDIMEAIWAEPSLHDSLGYAGEPLPQGFEAPDGIFTVPICELLPGTFSLNCSLGYEEVLARPDSKGGLRFASTTEPIFSDEDLGYCLRSLEAGLPPEIQREAVFMPLPSNPQHAAAAWRWANSYGIRLRRASECDLEPVSRPIAEQPPLPEPRRLIYIPEPEPEPEEVTAPEKAPVEPGPLRVGGQAVLVESLVGLNIRSGAGVDNPILGYLLPGQLVEIQDGPREVGTSPWFKIENLETGVVGWVNGVFLRSLSPPARVSEEPDEKAPAIVPPSEGLQIGGRARLMPRAYFLNVRSGPGTDNPTVGHIEQGDVILVQDGPQVVDGSHWYAILNESRDIEGWVNGRYLVPWDIVIKDQ